MSMEVARTILEQLGGKRFIVMTGAKNFSGDHNSLTFRFPTSEDRESRRVNAMRITLEASDTYTVKTFYVYGGRLTDVNSNGDIYCEDLQETFTDMTGLFTHL
jgi:hypothetical protein